MGRGGWFEYNKALGPSCLICSAVLMLFMRQWSWSNKGVNCNGWIPAELRYSSLPCFSMTSCDDEVRCGALTCVLGLIMEACTTDVRHLESSWLHVLPTQGFLSHRIIFYFFFCPNRSIPLWWFFQKLLLKTGFLCPVSDCSVPIM